ncbi:MAG: DNA-protecting protein DprA [Kineosporiaceae bacterium]|nr:DNA-protecting protein DprA [Kineosporiaceae bacterium]
MTAIAGSRFPQWYDPDDDRGCRVAWSRLIEPGDVAAWAFVAEYGAGEGLRLLIDRGAAAPGVHERWLVRLSQVDPVRDLTVAARFGGGVLVPGDPDWPVGLDDLGISRPVCLWVRGPMPVAPSCARSVAVVGARTATYYGTDLTSSIVLGCVEAGFTVISGGAYGIDAAAHRVALAAQGRTLAVLANGIDRFYPSGNDRLLRQVAEQGCVLSEVPPGSSPTRFRFLQRNRLIAAMATTTVVVEAAWRSGAQNTANHALGLGRPVGACPGPVTSALSAGCHRLLRNGAVCVCDAGEVVELASAIGDAVAPEPVVVPEPHDGLTAEQLRVYEFVPVRKPVSLDAISRSAGLEPATVRPVLAWLVGHGLVIGVHGHWVRSPRPSRDSSRGSRALG